MGVLVHRQVKCQCLQHMLVFDLPERTCWMQVLPGLKLINDHQHAVVAVPLRQLAVDVLEAGTNISSTGNLDVNCLCCFNDCPRESCRSLCAEELLGSRM